VSGLVAATPPEVEDSISSMQRSMPSMQEMSPLPSASATSTIDLANSSSELLESSLDDDEQGKEEGGSSAIPRSIAAPFPEFVGREISNTFSSTFQQLLSFSACCSAKNDDEFHHDFPSM
jgi:hypothetical protein